MPFPGSILNMPTLQAARGYIRRLLENTRVLRFLNANDRDLQSKLESIASAEAV